MANKIRIKDTGLNKVGGTVTYTPVNGGVWTNLDTFVMRGEFTVQTTNNDAQRTDPANSSNLTFESNEIAAIQAPRFTLQGTVLGSNSTLIKNIIQFGRSKGIKRLSGGAGIIEGMPEVANDTHDYISVIIKNITFTDNTKNSENYINFTIQLEQVR